MSLICHIVVDLGSSSGRVFLGRFVEGGQKLVEAHRFVNAPIFEADHWRWNWPYLRTEIRAGLGKAVELAGEGKIVSLGCSSWAQDFVLLDANGQVLENPFCYRDELTCGMPQAFAGIISPADLVRRVGCSVTSITALCKLKAMRDQYPELLKKTKTILHMADMVHFDLCARAVTDWTLATAGQLFNLADQKWDIDLLARLDIPARILPPVIMRPAIIGKISPDASPHPRLNNLPVISTAHHDTACATVALRPLEPGTFFLSLGSYGMPGLVLNSAQWPAGADPDEHALIGIADRRWALFAGCAGAWIIQECKRAWQERGLKTSHENIAALAEKSDYEGVIDLRAPRFVKPADMITEIRAACREVRLAEPEEQGDVAKVVFDSLAAGFERAVRGLEKAGQTKCRKLFLMGGGSKNQYLVRQMQERIGCEVVVGPVEATAIGNLILQREVMKE
jgi:sugar (pentulose or hexulose) kinase